MCFYFRRVFSRVPLLIDSESSIIQEALTFSIPVVYLDLRHPLPLPIVLSMIIEKRGGSASRLEASRSKENVFGTALSRQHDLSVLCIDTGLKHYIDIGECKL